MSRHIQKVVNLESTSTGARCSGVNIAELPDLASSRNENRRSRPYLEAYEIPRWSTLAREKRKFTTRGVAVVCALQPAVFVRTSPTQLRAPGHLRTELFILSLLSPQLRPTYDVPLCLHQSLPFSETFFRIGFFFQFCYFLCSVYCFVSLSMLLF